MGRPNGVLIVGPTGSGKSYLANKIFELCGNSLRFLSSSSILSTTKEIQEGGIAYCGETFTILDFPGVYDVSTEQNQVEADGLNTCKLVTAIQSCESIRAIVFVYSGSRFPPNKKIWYDRLCAIPSGYPALNILLLENKATELDTRTTTQNYMGLQALLKTDDTPLHYFRFGYFLPEEDTSESTTALLELIRQNVPVHVGNPNIPELCYVRTEDSQPFDELIVSTQRDDGQMVTTSRIEKYVTQERRWAGGAGKIFGKKKTVDVWRDRTVTESVHVPRIVTVNEIGTYKNVFKIRYDGTKDFSIKVEVGRSTQVC